MINGGVQQGLTRDQARRLVFQTVRGAAILAEEEYEKKGITPEQLRARVTSPNGTTQAALEHLAERDWGATIEQAVNQAVVRSRELSGM